MKKIVLLLAVALVLPGVAAAQDYVYTGREGKMMLVGDMASKRLEQKKAQKKGPQREQKRTAEKSCHAKEPRAAVLLLWPRRQSNAPGRPDRKAA